MPFSLASDETIPSLALSRLSSWTYLSLTGQDATSYLQGQVTCDVAKLSAEQSTLGAHCDAKGKMWSVFRLFHHKTGYALFQPLSAIETELKELQKYAIFSKVEIKQGTDLCFAVLGKEAQTFIDQLTPDQSGDVRHLEGGSAVKVSNQRWLVVLNEDSANTLTQQFESIYDQALWTLFDVLEAAPVLQQAEQNQHIPQALNLQALGAISFTKGCYTGQETVARAKYRGINKRAMYRVSGPRLESAHKTLERSVGDNWRSAGSLLIDIQFSNDRATGLIVLPNDLEPNTQLRLSDQPDAIWHIEPLPYSLEDN
jgi:folate-binding protein YgfZ